MGTLSWAEDDSELINVFGSEVAASVAEGIAESLGGHFKPAAS